MYPLTLTLVESYSEGVALLDKVDSMAQDKSSGNEVAFGRNRTLWKSLMLAKILGSSSALFHGKVRWCFSSPGSKVLHHPYSAPPTVAF